MTVVPAAPSAAIYNWTILRPGLNESGWEVTPDYCAAVAANYARYSGPGGSMRRPVLQLGHDKAQLLPTSLGWPACGVVTRCEPSQDGSVVVDVRGIPLALAREINAGRFPSFSVGCLRGHDPATGEDATGPVLDHIALLGVETPACPLPVPAAVFDDADDPFSPHWEARAGYTRPASDFADFDPAAHPRGRPGNPGQFAPKGGGSAGSSGEKDRDRPSDKPDRSERTPRAGGRAAPAARPGRPKAVAAAAGLRDPARRRRVIKAVKNEGALADAIGGFNLPDSEPFDVAHVGGGAEFKTGWQFREYLRKREALVKRLNALRGGRAEPGRFDRRDEAAELERFITVSHPLHFIEVKTKLVSADDAIHMSKAARGRKESWANRYGATFSVVAFDDRRGRKHSGHRVYVAPGELAGTIRLTHMTKAADLADVLTHATGAVPVAAG